MKKKFTFYDLLLKKRLLGLFFLLLLCNEGFSQTFCRPTSESHSSGGICVSTITDFSSSFDSEGPIPTTFTSFNTVVGVLCSVQQTLAFSQTAKAGDQIVLYVGNGAGLLNLSVLSTGTVQPKLNGVNAGAAVSLNNSLLSVTVLPGNSIGVLRYTLTADANQVQIQLGGLVSVLTELRLYDVRLEFAKPTVAGGLSKTICAGTSTTLTATPAANTTLAWYSSATSTTSLFSGNSFTTPTLTSNTTYYIGVTRTAGCESNERVPVVVSVSNPIAPAISSVGAAICSSGATQQTTLSVINPIPGTTYSWFNDLNGGVALAAGAIYSPTVSLGTTSYYVEASIGSCLSPTRTQVDVVSVAVPALPIVLTQSVTIQSGQNTTLNATTDEAGAVLNWYETATGGIAVATNTSTFTTPILTASKIYYVEAQTATGGCVSASRVPVAVTVQPVSLGGCLEANSQSTLGNGLCLLCSTTNPANSVDGNPLTAGRLTVPVGLLNGWVEQTLQFNNPGKVGDIITVELGLPGGILDLTALSYISLATYNGPTFNNDRVSINNLLNVQLLGGNRFRATIVAGANFDRVEVRLGGLATVLTSLDIYQATYKYKSPTVSGNTTICSGQTTTLTASTAVGETIKWYDATTAGNELAATVAFTTPALTTATTYYAEITRNGCVNSERFPVVVSVNNPVTPTISALASNICSGATTTITVQAPVTGTVYNWYDTASGGNLVYTGNSFATPALTADATYYVEAVVGTCSNTNRAVVTITVSPLPAVPTVASSTVVIPSGQAVTLQVSSPVAGEVYDWYDVPTGGTPLLANSTSYTPSPNLAVNKSFYISARNSSNCTSLSRAVINIIVTPPPVITSCLQPNLQAVATDGILCIGCGALPGTETLSVDGDFTTATTLRTLIGLGGYVQQRLIFVNPGFAGDIIEVELEIPTGILDVSALSYVTLESYNGTTANGDGVAINSLVDIQLLGGNRFKASFAAGADFTSVQIRLGGIAAVARSLNIYGASYKYKAAAISGNATAICSGQPVSLVASSTISGETYNWFPVATGGTAVSTSPTYNIPSITTTTTYYLEASRGAGACPNSSRQPVTVSVNPLGQATDISIVTPQEAACDGSIVLTPTSALAGAQFKYYTDQNKTTPIVDGGTGSVGQIYAIDPVTSALTVTGLTAAGASYNYFVSVVSANTCENANGNLKALSVTYPTTTTLVVTSPLTGCGSVNLKDAITSFDTTGNTAYTFFDPLNNVITAGSSTYYRCRGLFYSGSK